MMCPTKKNIKLKRIFTSIGTILIMSISIVSWAPRECISYAQIKNIDTLTVGPSLLSERYNNLTYLFFLPMKQRLLSDYHKYGEPKGFRVWSLQDGKVDTVVQLEKDELIRLMAVDHTESTFVTVIYRPHDKKMRNYLGLFNLNEKKWKWRTIVNDNPFFSVSFLVGDSIISLIGYDYSYWINSKTGNIIKKDDSSVNGYYHVGQISRFVTTSKSGNYSVIWNQYYDMGHGSFLVPKGKKELLVWDNNSGKILGKINKPESGVATAVFTQEEKSIILACLDDTIRIWDLKENQIKAIGYGMQIPNYLTISDEYLAMGKHDAKIARYPSLELFKVIPKFSGKYVPGEVMPLLFSSDGKYFAIEIMGYLHLYNTETWEELWNTETAH